jgi:CheY-like chemotaxis protein
LVHESASGHTSVKGRRLEYKAMKHVLLVEDHTDTRMVLGGLLSRCGCQMVTAKNAAEARARLDEMHFDFLLADRGLPDGDGADLVREAKRKHGLKAIAMTGQASQNDEASGMAAGFDLYLTKPIDLHALREALGCGAD